VLFLPMGSGLKLGEQDPCDLKYHGMVTIVIHDMDLLGKKGMRLFKPVLGH